MANDLDLIYAYLSETDPIGSDPYDAVIGFGMFDLALPRFCGSLYARGLARRIIFTGGVGGGTGNLGGPEADVWAAELLGAYPSIAREHLVLENRSTNTGENVAFTAARLEATDPELAFGAGLRRLLVVASPTRLRRVWLTLQRQQPSLQLARAIAPTTIDIDRAVYAAQGLDHAAHMLGELDRIESYAVRGWIRPEPLPAAIEAARRRCRGALHRRA